MLHPASAVLSCGVSRVGMTVRMTGPQAWKAATVRTTWPYSDSRVLDGRPGIVVVNYNTRRLVAQLIYSLYRTLRPPTFRLVVVDNGSTDESAELLSAIAAAGLCDLIANPTNRYHGPGLNQGVSYLAEATQREGALPISYVWLLDSDCVVMRPDALSAPSAVMSATGAALVGQRGYDTSDEEELLGLHSLLIDPAQVWQPTIQPFQDHGLPSEALQRSCAEAGLLAVDFPYTRGGYIIHIGRGSLRVIVETEDRANSHYEWATTHHEPHFALEAAAPAAYAAFQATFARDVPTLDAATLIQACRRASGEGHPDSRQPGEQRVKGV
jgi:Glycosyl transferase family 2